MARRGILGAILHDIKAAERERERAHRAAVREHEAALRRVERARKQALAAQRRYERETQAQRKRLEKEAKAAHVAVMEAEVEEKNAELAEIYDEIDGLLGATLDIDDFVDLDTLRRSLDNPPFSRPDLESQNPGPPPLVLPPEPQFVEPPPPKGFFGRRRRHREAIAAARAAHEDAHELWRREVDRIRKEGAEAAAEHAALEKRRLDALAAARAEHEREVDEHNAAIDTLVTNLGYGTTDAIEEYVGIVLSNSVYPGCFPVDYEHAFEASTAELTLKVMVPEPQAVPCVKHYKYRKSSDEIVETALPAKACRDRYASAVHQVALRSLHEVFEADRRALIRSIALQVGTETTDPATGLRGFRPFVAVAAERETFMKFDLSAVVPRATLEYLGASVSKDPYGLVIADVSGMRSS